MTEAPLHYSEELAKIAEARGPLGGLLCKRGDEIAMQIRKLSVENARLREALEKIAGQRGCYSMPWAETQEGYASFAIVTARVALGDKS